MQVPLLVWHAFAHLLSSECRISLPLCSTSGGMDRLSEFEANSALQDALTAGGRAPPLRMTAHIAKSSAGIAGAAGTASAPPSAAGVQQRVQALARLRLRCEPGWPLGLVVGEEMLAQYNSVFVLLLQVRLFCMRVQRGAGLGGQGAEANVWVVG